MANERIDTREYMHFRELGKPILIFQVIEGLRRGLTRFLGPSRVAVLMSAAEGEPLHVFDPYELLAGFRSELSQHYLESSAWREHPPFSRDIGEAYNCAGPLVPGLVSWGRQSAAVPYQMWFAECPQALCSTGPVQQWLAKASWIMAHELALGASLFTSSATHTLESYGLYAVSDFLLDELRRISRMEPGFKPEDVLKAICAISTTYEEGRRASGALMFLNPRFLDYLPSFVRFPEGSCPSIRDARHARKLLTMVEDTSRFLVSDGAAILGIGHGCLPDSAIVATFRSGHGEIQLGSQLVCTFRDGDLSGLGRSPQLHELEAALLRREGSSATRAMVIHGVMNLVQRAADRSHGCTIVIDFGKPPQRLHGQSLENPIPVIENLDLIEGMSRVDGALHIDAECDLHAFACLLDGKAVADEDLSRGARYNSALRFTASYPEAIAIVVSADGPLAILEGGRQVNQSPGWVKRESVYVQPPTLETWLGARPG